MDESTSIAKEIKTSRADSTAYIVFDTESIPDGKLVKAVKFPNEDLTPEQAIEKAQAEAREKSSSGSEFLPLTFQKPIAICTLRLDSNFLPIGLSCLDQPKYRPEEMVNLFWQGIERFKQARLVTFNGRGFDLPLLEFAAFDQGISAKFYFSGEQRSRYRSRYIDIQDLLNNQGACRLEGGLNLLARRLGLPGKMEVKGQDVYPMFLAGKLQEINDYCAYDTLDTYFVFLRTRVLIGEINLEKEKEIFAEAVKWFGWKVEEFPALAKYLANIIRENDK